MITKTNEVRIFTFTGHPEDLSDALIKRLESSGNRVIDIISATESMGLRQSSERVGLGMPSLPPCSILHYTMLYRLT